MVREKNWKTKIKINPCTPHLILVLFAMQFLTNFRPQDFLHHDTRCPLSSLWIFPLYSLYMLSFFHSLRQRGSWVYPRSSSFFCWDSRYWSIWILRFLLVLFLGFDLERFIYMGFDLDHFMCLGLFKFVVFIRDSVDFFSSEF